MSKNYHKVMMCGFCKKEIGVKNMGLVEYKISPIRGTSKIIFMCTHCNAILGIK